MIVNEGSDIAYGARPMKRFIQNEIETKLAYLIIEAQPEDGSVIKIDVQDKDFVLSL